MEEVEEFIYLGVWQETKWECPLREDGKYGRRVG